MHPRGNADDAIRLLQFSKLFLYEFRGLSKLHDRKGLAAGISRRLFAFILSSLTYCIALENCIINTVGLLRSILLKNKLKELIFLSINPLNAEALR